MSCHVIFFQKVENLFIVMIKASDFPSSVIRFILKTMSAPFSQPFQKFTSYSVLSRVGTDVRKNNGRKRIGTNH